MPGPRVEMLPHLAAAAVVEVALKRAVMMDTSRYFCIPLLLCHATMVYFEVEASSVGQVGRGVN